MNKRLTTNEVRQAAIDGSLNASGPVFALVYIGDRLDELGAEVARVQAQGISGLSLSDALASGLSDISRSIG